MNARTHASDASVASEHAAAPKAPTAPSSHEGLSPDEIRAEQAGDLPDREAMSVMSLGGVGIDVPPADHLDDFLRGALPGSSPPTDGAPVDVSPPVDGPIAEPPILQAPDDPVGAYPVDDAPLIGVPSLPNLTDDGTLEA